MRYLVLVDSIVIRLVKSGSSIQYALNILNVAGNLELGLGSLVTRDGEIHTDIDDHKHEDKVEESNHHQGLSQQCQLVERVAVK